MYSAASSSVARLDEFRHACYKIDDGISGEYGRTSLCVGTEGQTSPAVGYTPSRIDEVAGRDLLRSPFESSRTTGACEL